VSKGKQKALAKINAVINLTSGVCCHFGITGFTTNEQSLSDSILGIAKAGDLVIRDLGYFALEVFEKMRVKNIYYISRLRYGVQLFKDDVPIDMLKLLNKKQQVDVMVSCGAQRAIANKVGCH